MPSPYGRHQAQPGGRRRSSKRHSGCQPDRGWPEPDLPVNWRAVYREARVIYQRRDVDHYVVVGDGTEEWLLVLLAHGDRAYPAPLATRSCPVDEDAGTVAAALARESNDLIALTEADA